MSVESPGTDVATSYIHTTSHDAELSPTSSPPTTAVHISASQILSRSDLFLFPTVTSPGNVPSAPRNHARSTAEIVEKHSLPSTDIRGPFPAGLEGTQYAEGEETNDRLPRTASSSDLQDGLSTGAKPLQRAADLAGYLKSASTRMSKLLAGESMGYLEKVSGMWTASRQHYNEDERVVSEDRLLDLEGEETDCGHGDRFRAHFALPATERLRATYFGFLHRVLPLYGKIYISDRKFCFRSLLPGTRTKMILPLRDVENVEKEKGFRFRYHGLVLVIRGHEELFVEFSTRENRDDCAVTLLQNLDSLKCLSSDSQLHEHKMVPSVQGEPPLMQEACQDAHSSQEPECASQEGIKALVDEGRVPSIHFDDPRASIVNFNPGRSLAITCLTIGSRGDVQPYIALCKGLLAEGHRPRIATHIEFADWVRKHGIDFRPVDGDPAELMRICVQNGMFTYSFLREASAKFRSWIDELLSSAWKACQDSDVLIESPSAMAGIHVAEALRIPYFRAFTMPWTRTRAYPHAFAVPEHKVGGAYNYFSYVMFDNVFWKAIAGQVNQWRKDELGLKSTNMVKMQPDKVPFLYNFSPHVVAPPSDYSDWVRVTGYWFLDEAPNWTPPEDLLAFISTARADGKKLVYIGFGSIVVSDPAALTKAVVDSVLKADVRCILSKGWSDRLDGPAAVESEVQLPSEIHQIKSAPHDWLFRQIDAAVHHGGAGTTGASLRAGVPTVVKPFFGDQFFFGSRVEDLGVGVCLKKVDVPTFSRALWEAAHSGRMKQKAKILGEQIRKVSYLRSSFSLQTPAH